MKTPIGRSVVCVVWLGAVGIGIFGLTKYQSIAGPAEKVPAQWPAAAPIKLAQNRATLVLFAHPKCPCTRATIGELNRLLARCPQEIEAHVYFLNPSEFPDDWAQTDLWESAAAIPGVTVHPDHDGALARQFGAESSGSVLVYDAQGRLLFKGGITASRGHAGDNIGADTIFAAVTGKEYQRAQTPVFGCALFDSCSSTPKETSI